VSLLGQVPASLNQPEMQLILLFIIMHWVVIARFHYWNRLFYYSLQL